MKRILLFPIYLLCILQNGMTQPSELSIPAGYISTVQVLRPYGVDRWLIGIRNEPMPGAYLQDTLTVVAIDQDGVVFWRKNLDLPINEVHYWHDLLALPDGDILACTESTICDVNEIDVVVQRLDAQGNFVWQLAGGPFLGQSRPPEKWFLAPDGNLLGADFKEVWKVDAETGIILWKAPFTGLNNVIIGPYDFALIEGTENFFALGNPDLQIWKQSGPPGMPIYILDKYLDQANKFRRNLTRGKNGVFYCWRQLIEPKIERLNLDLEIEPLPMSVIQFGTVGIAEGSDGLYLIESNADIHQIRKFDFDGQNEVALQSSEHWLNPLHIASNNGFIAIGGEDGSGETQWSNYDLTCTGAWLRIFEETNSLELAGKPDVAITQIEQLTPVDSIKTFAFPFVSYDLLGGEFKLKISNLGNAFLENVAINTTFRLNTNSFCQQKPSIQKRYENLHLAPGASTWVNFDIGYIAGQDLLPTEICFWTSSPNQQPDAVHENDRFCHPISYTLGFNDISNPSLLLSPNPADDIVCISGLTERPGAPWSLWDLTGRLVETGICRENALDLDTSRLPNGCYLFQVNHQHAKLMVQHR